MGERENPERDGTECSVWKLSGTWKPRKTCFKPSSLPAPSFQGQFMSGGVLICEVIKAGTERKRRHLGRERREGTGERDGASGPLRVFIASPLSLRPNASSYIRHLGPACGTHAKRRLCRLEKTCGDLIATVAEGADLFCC